MWTLNMQGMSSAFLFLLLQSHFALYSCKHLDELLHWEKVTVHLRHGNRSILQLNKRGELHRGRLTALLGPSGCGKTTFLSLIAGKLAPTMSAMGPLKIVSDIAPIYVGSDVAFVYQDDAFFTMLTVEETLLLTANLRLVNHTTEERKQAIEDVMGAMALNGVADVAVGDARGIRGISGGERKRLAVACELLSKPKLLVADEPTSGLDSYQALSVVSQLKRAVLRSDLAGVITLHQPRSSIWTLLDDIVLLAANGRLVYHGPREEVLSYFRNLGFPCPSNTNPAEHLIDLVSVDQTSSEARKRSAERIDKLVESFTQQTTQHGKAGGGCSSVQLPQKNPKKGLGSLVSSGRGFLRRFGLLLQRGLRQTLRDGGVNFVRFGVSAVLAVVVGSVYGRQEALIDETSVGDRVTIIAQAAIQVSMLAMLKTLQLFKKERTVIVREISTKQYYCLEYLLSKSFAELPVDAMVAAFFGAILHHRTNLRCSRSDFIGTLALLGCASSSLGLAISALSPSGEIALAVGPALMVVYVIAGAVGPGKAKQDVSLILNFLRNASPIRPACEALCVAEFENQTFSHGALNRAQMFASAASKLAFAVFRFVRHPKRGTWKQSIAPCDQVLLDLGIDGKSSNGRQSLVYLLMTHTALAFLGLVASNLQV